MPSGAPACRECGSDAETGWAEDADAWSAEIPTGYGPEEDFDYDEYLSREFPGHANSLSKQRIKKWVTCLFVVIVCLAILLWLLAP